jgi:PAS domain S-box-containing protein
VELLVPDRFRAGHAAYCADFFADPTTRVMGVWREVCGRRRDGSELPLEVRLTPLEMAEGLFVLSAIVDISERMPKDGHLAALRQRADFQNVLAELGAKSER